MTATETDERFISPYDDPAPEAAEGWKELYPYYLLFREDRREIEEGKLLVRRPRSTGRTVFKPFDTIMVEFASRCLGQYNTRHYLVPPAQRGRLPRPQRLLLHEPRRRCPRRRSRPACRSSWSVPATTTPTGPRCSRTGKARCAASSPSSRRSTSSRCPTWCRSSWITEGRGLDNTFDLIDELQPADRAVLRGLAVPLRVPQPRLRGLPRLLRVLQGGVPGRRRPGHREDGAGHRRRPVPARRRAAAAGEARGRSSASADALASGGVDQALAAVAARPRRRGVDRRLGGGQGPVVQLLLGQRLLQHATRCGSTTSTSRSASCATTSARRAGEDIDRPTEAIARRARPHHRGVPRALLDDEARGRVRREARALAARCSPTSRTTTSTSSTGRCSVFWRKIRELGQVLADAGFWPSADDIFYVRRDELDQVLFDYGNGWAHGRRAIGP